MKTTYKQWLLGIAGLMFLSLASSADSLSNSDPAINNNLSGPNSNVENVNEEPVSSPASTPASTPASEPSVSESAAPQTEMAGFSRGTVARSIFTTLIDDREPVDKIKQVPEKSNDVFYFTELRDMSGQTAKHRWEFKGKVVAEVDFKVRGPRWRVWSKKSFTPGWSGDWKVSVVNGANEIISEEIIAFNEPTKDILEEETISNSSTVDEMNGSKNHMNEEKTNTEGTRMIEPSSPASLN